MLEWKVRHPLSSRWLSSVLISASRKSSCWGKCGRCSEGSGPQFLILFHRVRVHGRMFLLGLFRLYLEEMKFSLKPWVQMLFVFMFPCSFVLVCVCMCVCCPTSLKCNLSITHMVKLYVRYPMFSYFIFSLGYNIFICIPTAFLSFLEFFMEM